MRKELPHKLLRELLKNSKRSDRELARILKVSQPTITRTRQKLEKDGLIQDYTVVPDFREMGFEILAINFARIRPEILSSEELGLKAKEFIASFPSAVFASSGEGLGMNAISIGLYRNYTELHNRVSLMREKWKDLVESIQSFVVAIGEGEFKRFSLTHLKDVPL